MKIVVIGSGLGGLSTATMLARIGHEVVVLEQQARVGGCLQSFQRGDAHFETGMHYIGSAAPGEPLHRLLTTLGVLPAVTLSPLRRDAYDIVRLGGEEYCFANGREAFLDGMLRHFPDARQALDVYVQTLDEVSAASSIDRLFGTAADEGQAAAILARYQAVSTDAMIESLCAGHPRLAAVLAGRLPLIAARRGCTPYLLHAFITSFYESSAWRIAGGSSQIAQALVQQIAQAGGQVLTRCRVTAITADSHGVTGVQTADGRHFVADHVIADCHPAITLQLVAAGGSSMLRPAFVHRIASLEQTPACFVAYVTFRRDTVPYMPSNLFAYAGSSPWQCEEYAADEWPKGYLFMPMCDADSQRYMRSAMLLSYMKWSDVAPWADTRTGHRGEAYEAFKAERAERLLAAFGHDRPDLCRHIEAVWTSTPLTYRDYNGTPLGAMYGTAPDCRLGPAARVPIRWRLPGLLQTGQCVNSHGILGTLIGAMQTALHIPGAREPLARLFGVEPE